MAQTAEAERRRQVDAVLAWAAERRILLEHLSPSTLRDLAAAVEGQDPVRIARRQLTPEGVERLCEILAADDRPTVGFYRRYRVVDP
ncbi:MAG: hypothetical protein ABSB68_10105 [Acidimicrobiales bacterium]